MVLIDDITENRTRKAFFNCQRFELLNALVHTDAYVSHTHYSNHHTTVMLCTDDFLQSVDIMQSTHPNTELSFDDFFSGPDEDETEEWSYVSTAIISPYIEHSDLVEKTGRDYLAEKDACMEFVKQQAQTIS